MNLTKNELFEKLELMKSYLSTEELLDEIIRTLSSKQAQETLEFISDEHDMDVF